MNVMSMKQLKVFVVCARRNPRILQRNVKFVNTRFTKNALWFLEKYLFAKKCLLEKYSLLYSTRNICLQRQTLYSSQSCINSCKEGIFMHLIGFSINCAVSLLQISETIFTFIFYKNCSKNKLY